MTTLQETPVTTQPNSQIDEFKKCPYCAETVRGEAQLCRFCGKSLAPASPSLPRKLLSMPGGIFLAGPIFALALAAFSFDADSVASVLQLVLTAVLTVIQAAIFAGISSAAADAGVDVSAEVKNLTAMTYSLGITGLGMFSAVWLLRSSEAGLLLAVAFGITGFIVVPLWGNRLRVLGARLRGVPTLHATSHVFFWAGIASLTIVGAVLAAPMVLVGNLLARRAVTTCTAAPPATSATLLDLNKRFRIPVAVLALLCLVAVIPTGQAESRGDKSPAGYFSIPTRSKIDARIATATLPDGAAAEMNRHISDLSMHADVDAGTLTIRFRMDKDYQCPGCRFLVRLFDRNGTYITHFTSQQLYELFMDSNGGWNVTDPIELTYPLRGSDLREVAHAEFGLDGR